MSEKEKEGIQSLGLDEALADLKSLAQKVSDMSKDLAKKAVDNAEGVTDKVGDIVDSTGDVLISAGETIDVTVELENLGNDSSSLVEVTLYEMIDNPYITIIEGSESINNLSDGSLASFNLSFNVSNDAPYGHAFALQLDLESEENSSSSTLEMTVEALVESFESAFNDLDWSLSGNAEWSIDSDQFYEGCLTVTGIAQNERVVAVRVDSESQNLYNKIEGLPHVTIATNPETGGKPAMSNEFLEQDFEPIDPIEICGKVEEVLR